MTDTRPAEPDDTSQSGVGTEPPETASPPAGSRFSLPPLIRDVPDFPKPGVVFKDIGPLLRDPAAFATTITALSGAARAAVTGEVQPVDPRDGDPGWDLVAGIEARGFLLGAPVALRTGTGFVPVRKAGKLPGRTVTASYELEYGEATIEVQDDAVPVGSRVLVVDDVLATGGTATATIELVQRGGGTVVGVAVLLELSFLDGAAAVRRSGYAGPLVSLATV